MFYSDLMQSWAVNRFSINKWYYAKRLKLPFVRNSNVLARFKPPFANGLWATEFESVEDAFQALRIFSSSNRWNEFKPKEQPAVIVDLGANRGFSTVYWKGRFPQAIVHAVEMDRDNFLQCERVVRENGLFVNCHNMAIAGTNGTIEYLAHESHTRHRLNALVDSSYSYKPKGVEVQCLSFGAFIGAAKLERIDILKVDIEGAEKFLLEAPAEWASKVQTLLLEVHHNIDHKWAQSQLAAAGFDTIVGDNQARTEWWCRKSSS
jgi:FkbM family methyltransferase